MWSSDKRRKNTSDKDSLPDQESHAGEEASSETDGSEQKDASNTDAIFVLNEDPFTQKFEEQKDAWTSELRGTGGKTAFLFLSDDASNRVDLSSTHPGSLPQFISGNTVLLSQLVRDDRALRQAKKAANAIVDKTIQIRAARGLETSYLAVGTAEWNFEGEKYHAPVLLRPIAIRRFDDDIQLKLKRGTIFNEHLVEALKDQFGVRLDAEEFLRLAHETGVFRPQPVIEKLRIEAAGIPGFTVYPRLLVSTFANVAAEMTADVEDLDHVVLEAVAGAEEARERLANARRQVEVKSSNLRSPDTDTVLFSTDAQQDEALAEIVAGNSIAVRTLPGAGGTQTVLNAISELVRNGKKVLVVSPRRATLDGLAHRLRRAGLEGLATQPRTLRRNLVEAINRNEAAEEGQDHEIHAALVRLRTVILDYLRALARADDALGASPLETLHVLSTLMREENPPSTSVLLDFLGLKKLAVDRSTELEALVEVARLGQFDFGPDDSPWYNVSFHSSEEAQAAHQKAVGLSESKLPRLISEAGDAISNTPLRPYTTIAELGVYLRLFTGLRETLDRFLPEVFDRSLTEIIAAHAPRGSEDISASSRRRLRKLAKEYVRPGVSVDDMYSRLVQIQQQRVLWQRYSAVVGARPEIPSGISDLVDLFQDAYEDLDFLDVALDPDQTGTRLRNLELNDLAVLMNDLARESDVLQNIHERTALVEQLNEAGLGGLLDDLSAKHVPIENVANELELAWWQSALEHMLEHNKQLLGANTAVVERLESDFRLVDDAHIRANGPSLAFELAKGWRIGIKDHQEEAQALREILRSSNVTIDGLVEGAPNLLPALAPVWALSPYEVPLLPRSMHFDVVLMVDSSATTLAEQIPGITRANQVVAFGDPAVQKASTFSVALTDEDPEFLDGESAFEKLSAVLPTVELTQSYRSGGADLLALVNERFYDGKINAYPQAGTFLGETSFTHTIVSGGQGLPDEISGAVETTEAEVEKVVQLVIQHAREHVNDSLIVITINEKHATRIQQAVFDAASRYVHLQNFLKSEHLEPFVVVTVEQAVAQSRDRAIFTVGYGKTPHGRMLSHFGTLSAEGAEWLVAVAMTRARKGMTLVSSFSPKDLDVSRIAPGVNELREIMLQEVTTEDEKKLPEEIDPLLHELSHQLEKLGVEVELDYKNMIPLVAKYQGRAVAVDTDAEIRGMSLREILRLRPSLLRRLGWQHARVHSFDLFSDPVEVALRIAQMVGYEAQPENTEDDTSEYGTR